MRNKKAQFAEVDFFLAILILGLGLVVITAPFIHVRDDIQADRLSYDAVNMLSSLKLKDLDASFQADIRSNFTDFGIVYSDEDTMIGLITKLLVRYNETSESDIMGFAEFITNEVLRDVIPSRYKFEVSVQSGTDWYDIISIPESEHTDIASQSRTLLTGLEVGQPITGFVSSGFIREARKVDSAYYFIGGFVGQGDLSFMMGINSDEINNFYVEGIFADNFSIFVNSNKCADDVGAGFVSQTFSDCVEFVEEGDNIINVTFLGDDLTKKYISGGNIRIDYNVTDSLSKSLTSTERRYITGVDGVINIYDSFYVPGRLVGVNFYLEHDINITFNESNGGEDTEANLIMTIADQKVYETTDKGFVQYTQNNVVVGDYVNATIPFRIGFEEFSATVQDASAVDIILVTDLSGSMNWDTSGTQNCPDGNCTILLEPGFGSDFSINVTQSCPGINEADFPRSYRRIDVAKCLNLEFINRTFSNVPDSRIGMVGYRGDVPVADYIDLSTSDDFDALWDYASTMTASGNTCSSCGVAAANYMLQNFFVPDRQRVIVFMTDGVANRCFRRRAPLNFADAADFGGVIPPASGGTNCHTVTAPNHFLEWANYSKYGSLEVDFYSIGFRVPNLTQYSDPLIQAATNGSEDGGYYFSGDDGTSLSDIYLSISDAITIAAGYVDQVINVSVDEFDVFESRLFENSYIEFEYIPYEIPELAGTIKLTEEQQFLSSDCSQSFTWTYDDHIRVGRGFLTSYSGNIWTSNASINNNPIFDVFSYGGTLGVLGDPFVLGVRSSLLSNENNVVNVSLHDGDSVQPTCNPNNKLIYDIHFPAFFSSEGVKQKSEGCVWTIDSVGVLRIPEGYSGPNTGCSYNPLDGTSTYDIDDALQVLGYNILSGLTYDGGLIIDFDKSDVDVSVLQVDDVPYLWGPALLGVTVWR